MYLRIFNTFTQLIHLNKLFKNFINNINNEFHCFVINFNLESFEMLRELSLDF